MACVTCVYLQGNPQWQSDMSNEGFSGRLHFSSMQNVQVQLPKIINKSSV